MKSQMSKWTQLKLFSVACCCFFLNFVQCFTQELTQSFSDIHNDDTLEDQRDIQAQQDSQNKIAKPASLSELAIACSDIGSQQNEQLLEQPSDDISIGQEYENLVVADSVKIQFLDKNSCYTETIVAPVNQYVKFKNLKIFVHKCFKNLPQDSNEAVAYISVIDEIDDSIKYENWLFASCPSVNLFEHPIYDIRVVSQ